MRSVRPKRGNKTNISIVGVRHLLKGTPKTPESNVTPIVVLLAQTGDKSTPQAPLVALLDSGTTSCIAISNRVPDPRLPSNAVGQ